MVRFSSWGTEVIHIWKFCQVFKLVSRVSEAGACEHGDLEKIGVKCGFSSQWLGHGQFRDLILPQNSA